MTKYTFFRWIRPAFANFALALTIALTAAFASVVVDVDAQGEITYVLTASDVVCGDPALTQNCGTFAGKTVTLVQSGDVLQVMVGGQLAGYMKPPVVAAPTSAPQGTVPTVNVAPLSFTFGGLFTDVMGRVNEVVALGMFHLLYLLAVAIVIPLLPPVENNYEQRVYLNGYYLRFVGAFALMILIQYLVVQHRFDWLLSFIVLKTGQSWVPGAINWILGAGTLMAAYFGMQVIYSESGSSSSIDAEAGPETVRFKDLDAYESHKLSMGAKGLKLVDEGMVKKTAEPYYIVQRKMKEVAKQDKSYITSTLFMIWLTLEVFGVFIVPFKTSLIGLDVFDPIIFYAIYLQWGKEIYAELGQSWKMVLQTLSVGIAVGGMYLILKSLALLIPTTNVLSVLRLLPNELAALFLPAIYILIQGKAGYVKGTTDVLCGVLLGTVGAAQIFAPFVFG